MSDLEREKERILEQAAHWVTRRDMGFTAEEQDKFFEWMAENPMHAEAYRERQKVWDRMNVLAEWRPEHSNEPNPDLLAMQPRFRILRSVVMALGIAAVLIFGLFIGKPLLTDYRNDGSMFASGDGAQSYEYHALSDGSVVELNRGAQVLVDFSRDERHLVLVSGEAYFTVAKDMSRPFVVEARGVAVRAVGTAFNVSLESEKLEVLVTEGVVSFDPYLSPVVRENAHAREPESRELKAGQASVISLADTEVSSVVEVIDSDEIMRRLAWKNQVLDFVDTPLSEVVLEFNRRNHTQIVIQDRELSELEFSGTLQSNNIDMFVELLAVTNNIQAENLGDGKITLKKDRK